MTLTRRKLLAGAAAGGGLLVVFSLLPRTYRDPLEPGPDETAFDAWIKIAGDGVVTVAVPQLEMGQGVTTILPQIVALELGADWRQVAVQPAPVSAAYANFALAARWAPLWRPLIPALADEPDDLLLRRWARAHRFAATAAGTTLAAFEQPCREAAATTRGLLAKAAARRWNVGWEDCDAAHGFITHGDKRLAFADLAAEAGGLEPPTPPPLRTSPPSERVASSGVADTQDAPLAFPRLDLPSKVDGSWQFAADVRLPGMVYAAIRHGPRDRSRLVGFDTGAAGKVPGLVGVVRGKRWLAAAARNWWAAEQALDALAPRFATDHPVNSDAMDNALDDALHGSGGTLVASSGQGDAPFPPEFARRYDVMPGLHATIETTAVTARLNHGMLELWMASQMPESARVAAARAIGISPLDVILYPMSAGGSFDRRLEHEQAIEAALLARELQRPVQLVWSRREEQLGDMPRAPAAATLAAQITTEGTIARMRMHMATPPTMRETGRRLFANRTTWSAIDSVAGEADPLAVNGVLGSYAIPDAAVIHIPVRIDLPTSRMRGGADALTCFMREGFIDEVAQQFHKEPLAYRMGMIGNNVRLGGCLQRVSQLAQWDGGARGTGQGIACHTMGPPFPGARAMGHIAVVASARAGKGGVRVSQVFAAVDIGRIINRDIALQQVEGGLIFGLAMALGCATQYRDGIPANERLADLALPLLDDTPDIAVAFIESDEDPFEPGEIGVPAIAPAVANALYSATGLRLRRLPLLSDAT